MNWNDVLDVFEWVDMNSGEIMELTVGEAKVSDKFMHTKLKVIKLKERITRSDRFCKEETEF